MDIYLGGYMDIWTIYRYISRWIYGQYIDIFLGGYMVIWIINEYLSRWIYGETG